MDNKEQEERVLCAEGIGQTRAIRYVLVYIKELVF